jgi:hypothetical protein
MPSSAPPRSVTCSGRKGTPSTARGSCQDTEPEPRRRTVTTNCSNPRRYEIENTLRLGGLPTASEAGVGRCATATVSNL